MPPIIKIVGGRQDGKPARGQDIAVLLEGEDGREHLIPALSLTLVVDSRQTMALATITVPAHLVSLKGVRIETVADVDPRGPESQWEEALGQVVGEGLPLADADAAAKAMAELDAVIAAGGKVE